jgi:hypothetical protein|nr:MAG TPA_asm: hypothetical protein [Caudoviricetes sp.]
MNKAGIKISYDCQSLINELKQDIEEFGSHLILDVVVQDVEGVTIYKDYNFIENDPETEFTLEPGERIAKMTAATLLMMYEKENELL